MSEEQFSFSEDLCELQEQLINFRKFYIQVVANALSKGREPCLKTRGEMQERLKALASITPGPEMIRRTQIDTAMRVIVEFPFNQEEKELATRLQSNWGCTNENRAAPPPPQPNTATKTQTRESSKAQGQVSSVEQPLPPRPNPAHPIYGRNGIMEGVLVRKAGRTSYVRDPEYRAEIQRRKPQFHMSYGHNGFNVGDWFPSQFKACVEAIHGAPQAGVSFPPGGGAAYSIVLCAKSSYAHLNKDRGDQVFYCGPGSDTNTEPRPQENGGTRALQISELEKTPIRLLRSAGNEKKGIAPVCGIRYDGLYLAVSHREEKNALGGAFILFQLVRMKKQAPIAGNRPTKEERIGYLKAKDWY